MKLRFLCFRIAAFLLAGAWLSPVWSADGARLNLANAVVLAPASLTAVERQAVLMLIEEVEKRSQVRWQSVSSWPDSNFPVIAVGPVTSLRQFDRKLSDILGEAGPAPAEGYRVQINQKGSPTLIVVSGNDSRGVMFGVGRFLRELKMSRGQIEIDASLSVVSAPKSRLRGHQLGYRPKTNSYDAWDAARWEQYFRDLIVFGCNAIELIPPRSDDHSDSPHFPKPPLEMMIEMSRLADQYGLDVWVWYPAMDKDYSDRATVQFALEEWSKVFEAVPRIDAVFVPGGDPGHTRPKHLLALLKEEVEQLHRFHPKAQMWVSPQSFDQAWLDEFFSILQTERPVWLSGIVYGPQVRVPLPAVRQATPAQYPIRHYPDITHSRQCEYPVLDWDAAYAVTEARECINPRPMDEATIFRATWQDTAGFLTYSEGCNDDVNKAIWSALGWEPNADVAGILRSYSRYFIGNNFTDSFAQGLLALERNWRGPLLANEEVETTLQQFQAMERSATPQQLRNWRFLQGLFRAYYDAYTRRRLLYETGLEKQAMEVLQNESAFGTLTAMTDAERVLNRAITERVCAGWRARILELGEALYQSIGMQLSVSKYKAIAVDRGAAIDTIDFPLNNRYWLKEQFSRIRKLTNDTARIRALEEIVQWENPGPGGFYDDLGNPGRQPHLVRGPGLEQDPGCFQSPRNGFEEDLVTDEDEPPVQGTRRVSWLDHAESLYDAPLHLRYTSLDPASRYKVKVVYAGDTTRRKIRLTANETIQVHPLINRPTPFRPLEFDLPAAATAGGTLTLTWSGEAGLGGNGRGCQVSEIWLIRRD